MGGLDLLIWDIIFYFKEVFKKQFRFSLCPQDITPSDPLVSYFARKELTHNFF